MENNKKTVILLRILPIIGVILSILTAIFLRANYDTTLHFKYFLLNPSLTVNFQKNTDFVQYL